MWKWLQRKNYKSCSCWISKTQNSSMKSNRIVQIVSKHFKSQPLCFLMNEILKLAHLFTQHIYNFFVVVVDFAQMSVVSLHGIPQIYPELWWGHSRTFYI